MREFVHTVHYLNSEARMFLEHRLFVPSEKADEFIKLCECTEEVHRNIILVRFGPPQIPTYVSQTSMYFM